MSARILVVVCIAVLLLSSVACDRTADKQRQEEAINRGVPTAEIIAMNNKTFKVACERAGGGWQATTSRCATTAVMCPSPGEWNDAIGCVFSDLGAAECGELESQGMQLVGEVCAITDISSEQFEQLGLGGER